ncbi:MAG: hypothetical protein LJF15_13075 [Acidobacteria bacterium]|nr:hypothetical protein [Acidobacteriota bacterium]
MMMAFWTRLDCVALGVCFTAACTQPPPPPPEATGSVGTQPFVETPEGIPVRLHTLTNAHGLEARAMTHGGVILRARDTEGL